MPENSVDCACGVAPEGRHVRACNEEAFRELLAFERARAARLHTSVLLLLVSLGARGDTSPVPVFDVLGATVRESDLIGWLRRGRVAAAVLVQGGDLPDTTVFRGIRERVAAALSTHVPLERGRRPRVRIVQLGPGSRC